jgi:DNA-binding response OmpR family regulator
MNFRILLCDDEFAITKTASVKLTKLGYAVRACHEGEAGWAAYRLDRPDLLVTDLQMPRLDGLGLIRRIRERDAALPVVLLTAKGYELDETLLRAELGPLRLFAKPFSPRELAETVGEMLGTSQVAIVN